MKRLLAIFFVILMLGSLAACNKEPSPTPNATVEDGYVVTLPEAAEQTNYVQFIMSDGMTFVVELCPEYAPVTVENFKNLVASDHYDGLTFHRIYKNFMIQGGNGRTAEKYADPITGEFAENGWEANTLSHTRGVISMARTNEFDSATDQFFVVHADSTFLDGKYAAFGRVVAGMETIDVLANVAVTNQGYPSYEETKPVTAPIIRCAYFVEFTPAAEN